MEKKLDVSMLEPCEPLERTLEAVRDLKTGDYLRVIHRREPHMLYPMLEKNGLGWRCLETEPGRYEIFIWMRDDAVAAAAIDRQGG